MTFRKVTAAEIDQAYAIYLEAFAWLKAKGVRQWLRALPVETFVERGEGGELFGLFTGLRLAAIVTLVCEADTDWKEVLGDHQCWWIKSLVVAREFSGRELGHQVIADCETRIRESGATTAFLDCVDGGFLPGYYTRLGYSVMSRRDITYRSGNTFPMVLMKKSLPSQSSQMVRPAGTPPAGQEVRQL